MSFFFLERGCVTPMFQVTVRRPSRIALPEIDMRRVGEIALASMKERIGHAVNVQDQPAKPLVGGYQRQKARAGAKPQRDLRLTGHTMDALAVTEVNRTRAVIAFNDGTAELRAKRSEAVEGMLGLSRADKKKVLAEMQQQLGRHT
ncbi:MAG TPA: hypothetical protein VHB50_14300 [Bryobacteraceae bacterium]|nr:hypothetical protein [Bryobacteraceae bacterium]